MRFETSHAQMLFADLGYYRGAIDGVAGPKTRAAVNIVEANASRTGAATRSGWPDVVGWSADRRLVAAAQAALAGQGVPAHDPGPVDGWFGPRTDEALVQWLSARAGTSAAVERIPANDRPEPGDLPTQSGCAAHYGQPGTAAIRARITYAQLPVALRLDWNLDQYVSRIRIHEKCAPSLTAAVAAVLATYGEARMRALGLDRFAGSYVERRMRGGTSWSMHAYGCAIDIFAAPNGLRTRCPDALFCKPEYRDFLDIMEAHNWLPAIRLWGADAMHFQQARL